MPNFQLDADLERYLVKQDYVFFFCLFYILPFVNLLRNWPQCLLCLPALTSQQTIWLNKTMVFFFWLLYKLPFVNLLRNGPQCPLCLHAPTCETELFPVTNPNYIFQQVLFFLSLSVGCLSLQFCS